MVLLIPPPNDGLFFFLESQTIGLLYVEAAGNSTADVGDRVLIVCTPWKMNTLDISVIRFSEAFKNF